MLSKKQFGIPGEQWSAAKAEVKAILAEVASRRAMITYTDLTRKLVAVSLAPHDPRLFHLLGAVSSEEDEDQRGLLTVIVVHKVGDMQPGPGYFELAKARGRDTTDVVQCWVDELHKVHAVWSLPRKTAQAISN